MDNRELLFLVQRYYQVQKHRLALGEQIRSIQKEGGTAEVLQENFDDFYRIEQQIAGQISRAVTQHEMWEWLSKVKGIGPVFAGGLLSVIDITRAEHRSSVWRFAGLTPDQKRVKGEKLTYDPFLKTLCWKIGESFVKTKGWYRKIYDTSKMFYQNKFPHVRFYYNGEDLNISDDVLQPLERSLARTKKPDKVKELKKEVKRIKDLRARCLSRDWKGYRTQYTKAHIHEMSRRRTVKLFLADFWEEWRKCEGLPVSEPFMHRGLYENPQKDKRA